MVAALNAICGKSLRAAKSHLNSATSSCWKNGTGCSEPGYILMMSMQRLPRSIRKVPAISTAPCFGLPVLQSPVHWSLRYQGWHWISANFALPMPSWRNSRSVWCARKKMSAPDCRAICMTGSVNYWYRSSCRLNPASQNWQGKTCRRKQRVRRSSTPQHSWIMCWEKFVAFRMTCVQQYWMILVSRPPWPIWPRSSRN